MDAIWHLRVSTNGELTSMQNMIHFIDSSLLEVQLCILVSSQITKSFVYALKENSKRFYFNSLNYYLILHYDSMYKFMHTWIIPKPSSQLPLLNLSSKFQLSWRSSKQIWSVLKSLLLHVIHKFSFKFMYTHSSSKDFNFVLVPPYLFLKLTNFSTL